MSETRRARAPRSTLLEAVELTGVGAAASLVAVTIVLIVVRETNIVDTSALADDPGRYLLEHPLRGLGSLLASFALSCLLTWLGAHSFFGLRRKIQSRRARSRPTRRVVFEPAGSTWENVFNEDRRDDDTDVVVTLELVDGRRLAGVVRSYTTQLEDNRELALAGPLCAAPNASAPLEPMGGQFLVVREDQIATITGVYVDQPVEPPEPVEPAASAAGPRTAAAPG